MTSSWLVIARLAIRLVKVVLTAFVGAIVGGAVFNQEKTLAMCIVSVLLIVAWISESTLKNNRRSLNIVLRSIYKTVKGNYDGNIRCALWIPCRFKKETLKQALNYIPSDHGRGRKLNQSKGIVGRCFREKRMLFEHIKEETNFKKYMVENWGFTNKDAEQLTLDRRSYMCLPILSRKEDAVLGG